MTPEEFRRAWKWDRLSRALTPAWRSLSAPDTAWRFLVEVGLPTGDPLANPMVFDLSATSPRRLPDLATAQLAGIPASELLIIGEAAFERWICLNQRTGSVFCINPDPNVGPLLVNSRIDKMAELLIVGKRLEDDLEKGRVSEDTDDSERILTEAVRRIDPDVADLSPNHGLWAEIIDDISMGLA